MRRIVCLFLLAALVSALSGCSPQERRGISPLPQNRPADWEVRPYGPMQN